VNVGVDVVLPAGWLPLGTVPGALLAAAATGRDGRAVATMVIRMHHCAGLTAAEDGAAVLAAVADGDMDDGAVRDVRWCGPETIAVLAACAGPGLDVTAADLTAALRQTAVYAVDSTGRAISPSSAAAANDGCRGSTRTV
jgi:hypothetical protein